MPNVAHCEEGKTKFWLHKSHEKRDFSFCPNWPPRPVRRVAAVVLKAAFGDLSRRNQRQLSHIRGAKRRKQIDKGRRYFFLKQISKILIC